MDDLVVRAQSGDENILSGINKFICTYEKLKKSHCPSPSIAHGLHMFGKEDRKFLGFLLLPLAYDVLYRKYMDTKKIWQTH